MSRWIARSQARQRLRIAGATPPRRARLGATAASATSGISLFFPRIGVVVVAADLPVARLVVLDEAHAGDPLGALPEVEIGDQTADRRAVLERERLAAEPPGHHGGVGGGLLERSIRGVAVRRLEDDEARLGLDLRALGQRRDLDAAPQPADQRPAGDAGDVGLLLDHRQLEQPGVVDLERRLDRTVDAQPEVADVAVALRAAHRPELLERALPGRQPGLAIAALLGARLAPQVVARESAQRA